MRRNHGYITIEEKDSSGSAPIQEIDGVFGLYESTRMKRAGTWAETQYLPAYTYTGDPNYYWNVTPTSNWGEVNSVTTANTRVQQDFGPDWEVGEWNNWSSWTQSMFNDFLIACDPNVGANFPSSGLIGMMRRNNSMYYTSTRAYFSDYFQGGNKPSWYGSAANYYSNYICLGSWYNLSQPYVAQKAR